MAPMRFTPTSFFALALVACGTAAFMFEATEPDNPPHPEPDPGPLPPRRRPERLYVDAHGRAHTIGPVPFLPADSPPSCCRRHAYDWHRLKALEARVSNATLPQQVQEAEEQAKGRVGTRGAPPVSTS